MSPRLIIAVQSGLVIGLLGLNLYQARQLGAAHRELDLAATIPVDLPTNGSQRQLRLRLHQLPPINLPTRVERLDWRSLESDDYATYVANLRAAGCPEETIRDILLADVNKLYAQRRRALAPKPRDFEFWRSEEEIDAAPASEESRRRDAELAALEAERRQLLATLLGPAANRSELEEFTTDALEDRALQFLPEEKRRAVAAAEARSRQERAALDLIPDPAEREAREASIRKSYEETLAATLTPEEREQLDLRASPLAARLREQLRGFGATREEFETLYRLEARTAREQEALEAALDSGQDPQATDKLEASRLELEQALATTLGPQRFAEYQRSQDPDYQTLFNLTREHQVPPALAGEVYDMRHTVQDQTDRIRNNPLLTAEQKIRAFLAIRNETQAAIVEVLGEPLLQEYRRQGGSWLNELTDIGDLGETGLQIVPPPLPEPEATVATEPEPRVVPFPRQPRFRRNR